ncbi:MAG: phenylalanine--tRNA ligase subunit beta [Chloroflexi bacterium]|nr:phenylalanine--tRNA ligase subunit beta [Chloroflexota bacterium]
MRVPLKWLSEYVDLTLDPRGLADKLTVAGVEVGEVISAAGEWEGIYVGEVVDVSRHPNADRLVLATVELAGERQTVVCGAPNVAVGQKVPFARTGARLIDGRTGQPTVLEPAVIRGVESAGMVCSEKELGLSDYHEGILVLADDAPVGVPLAAYMGDVIFDIDVTPNRPDLLAVVGVAREVAALTDVSVREPSIEYAAAGKPIKGRAQVEIADPDLCPRYVAALIEGITMGESPPWMQERLIGAGLRPINNVVDITNYVMLEMGQPLHAFDFKRLRRGQIVVRRARTDETLLLLDGTEQKLSPEMLVIADAEVAVAVAGVMGGLDSEIDLNTTNVLLESANFHGPSIRRTAAALKVRTDASYRFEKGLSPELPPIAAQRAVKLMVELCGGKAAAGIIDVHPKRRKDVRITLTQKRLHTLLGMELPVAQVRQVLSRLGFSCRWMPPDRFVVRVPYWRTDVTIADDVVEEIARIIGYDELPMTRLRGEFPAAWPQPRRELRDRVADLLAAAGMQEVVTYSLSSLEQLARVLAPEELSTHAPLRIANPMSQEQEYARTSLRASLLRTLADNVRHREDLIALFETARVYLPREDDLPEEVETVAAVISGRLPDRWGEPAGEPAGFYEAKSYLDLLVDHLGVSAQYAEATDYALLPGRAAAISVDDQRVGIVGQVHPRVASQFGLEAPVAMFELNLDALLPHVTEVRHYRPVAPYPSLDEDLAVVVSADVPAARVRAIIQQAPLVRAARLFDVYSGPQVPSGKKSLAFSVSYQASDHTLTDEEVRRQRESILIRLRQEVGGVLRS